MAEGLVIPFSKSFKMDRTVAYDNIIIIQTAQSLRVLIYFQFHCIVYIMQNHLIYAAAYIEGDGCFRLNTYFIDKIKVYERSITITSVCEETILYFLKTFGGYTGIAPFKERHKKAYVWTIKGNKAFFLAKKLFPYFVSKKIECSIFIDLCKTIIPNDFKKICNETIETRNDLLKQFKIERHESSLVTKHGIENLYDFKKTIIPTHNDYIFLAGLADSEGCFRISSRHRNRNNKREKIYNTTFEIGNTKIEIIKWCVERFGGSIVFVPAQKRNKGRRNFATWGIHAKSLFPILSNIRPFLKNKKSVCEELIKFQQTILPNGGDRHSESFRKDFLCRVAEREKIIVNVHKLNKRGI